MDKQPNSTCMLDEEQINTLYQYAMTLCQQSDDAYDLLQTAIEKYLIEIKCQHSIKSPTSYLRTLIRNRFIDNYRYQQRWDNETYEEDSTYNITPITPENICINSMELQTVWSKLSAQDRDILYHWALLGYSTDEACDKMGMSRGTFLSRIHRVRKRLLNDQSISIGPDAEDLTL